MAANWLAPALAVAAVFGGVAIYRKYHQTAKPGDYVAVDSAVFGPPAALPFETPVNAPLLVRVDTVDPNGAISGQIVGYVAASSPDLGTLPFGGAAGIATPVPIQPASVKNIFRGSPPRRVS